MPRKVTKYMNATEEFNCKACSKTSQLDKKANKPRWLLPWIAETQIQQSQSKTDQAATTSRKSVNNESLETDQAVSSASLVYGFFCT